ncbi:MAG: aminopeptidase P N-terminal domain-containing protein [Longimicrobiales bacterium]|nr:aminopeptidase P N-terminal domain-containing protein [Longimicrobiales bacterium]
MAPPDPSAFPSIAGISAEGFARRRQQVLDRLDGGAMVLPGAPMQFRSRDTEYRYRPDSELFYLTGVTEPGVVAWLGDPGDESDEESARDSGDEAARFVLFVRSRDPEAERWSGPWVGPDQAVERFGADAAYPLDELEDRLPGLLKRARRIHYRLGVDDRTQSIVLRALREARRRGPRKGTGPRAVVDPGEILDDLRLRKDGEEIESIRRAARITVEGFRDALAAVRPGAGEWEIEAALESAFRRRGARGPAFPTISGSGPNACYLHYVRNDRRMASGELLLVDGGADVGLYHGDVTRTVPVDGTFSPEQRELYEVVEAAREAAIDAVVPGVSVEEVHRAALDVLVDGMLDLDLLKGEKDEILETEAYKAFYPHSTSHWLGLDVHDPGDYAREGDSRLLEPGMVLTIEPGLYVPESGVAFPPGKEGSREEAGGEGEEGDGGRAEKASTGDLRRFSGKAVEGFAGIGIRIEDDVLVTEEGRENLTADLPTHPDEVTELVGRGGAGGR